MRITFYNVTPHPMSYPADLKRPSQPAILHAFVRALAHRHRDLIVKLHRDGRHGKIYLKSGPVVAHFNVD